MEQITIWITVTLAFGAFMFYLGQRSVKLIGQRTEYMQPSDRRFVTETSAVRDETHYGRPETDNESQFGVTPPEAFKSYVAQMRKQTKGGE